MADYKILGQALDKLDYFVPEGKNTVFSKISVHNTSYPATLSVAAGDKEKFDISYVDKFFDPRPGTNGYVPAVAFQPDGKALIGGPFNKVGGVTHNRIARLNSDGTVDTSFDPNPNGIVYSIVPQPDGKILIGGSFFSVSGVLRNCIALIYDTLTIQSVEDDSAYLIKDKSLFYDEKLEISGGVALESGQVLTVEQSGGENIIIQAYGAEL